MGLASYFEQHLAAEVDNGIWSDLSLPNLPSVSKLIDGTRPRIVSAGVFMFLQCECWKSNIKKQLIGHFIAICIMLHTEI